MSARSRSLDFAATAILSLSAFGANSAAACDARIVERPTALRMDYDPFASAEASGHIGFGIENRSGEACSMDLALLGGDRRTIDETQIGASGVRVRFVAGIGDARLAATNAPGLWRVRLDPGKVQQVALDVIVIRDAIAEAGDHSVTLGLELRESGELASVHGPDPVTLVLVSAPRAQMNIAGAAGAFGEGAGVSRVDFGEMTGGDQRRVFLQVRANIIARLTIDSINRGLLKLAKDDAAENAIRYTATLNGTAIDLRQHFETRLNLPRTIAGSSLPFDLRLGDVGARVAGTYTDLLTIEFSPL